MYRKFRAPPDTWESATSPCQTGAIFILVMKELLREIGLTLEEFIKICATPVSEEECHE